MGHPHYNGDVGAGIAKAARWIARELPVYSLNCVLATSSEVWALRYPDTHRLMLLERATGGHTGVRHLDAASPAGTVRVRAPLRPAAVRTDEPLVLAALRAAADR